MLAVSTFAYIVSPSIYLQFPKEDGISVPRIRFGITCIIPKKISYKYINIFKYSQYILSTEKVAASV
jgi:hypothetical protein